MATNMARQSPIQAIATNARKYTLRSHELTHLKHQELAMNLEDPKTMLLTAGVALIIGAVVVITGLATLHGIVG